MHAEHVHEDADAGALFPGQRIGLALDADDTAVGRADGQAGRGGHHAFGVTEEMEGEPAQGQGQDSGDRPVETGENKGRQGRDADGGPAFGGDAAGSRAHAVSPGGMENRAIACRPPQGKRTFSRPLRQDGPCCVRAPWRGTGHCRRSPGAGAGSRASAPRRRPRPG